MGPDIIRHIEFFDFRRDWMPALDELEVRSGGGWVMCECVGTEGVFGSEVRRGERGNVKAERRANSE